MAQVAVSKEPEPKNALFECWVCGGASVTKFKDANYNGPLTAENFAITDSAYGVTHDIYKCGDCGFLFSPDTPEVLGFYEGLVDEGYEDSRRQRLSQAEGLLKTFCKFLPKGRTRLSLLDVGAGSGILMEEAGKLGFQTTGVEPSEWLSKQARERGLNVLTGVLPHKDVAIGSFDAVTLIDVIEHVPVPSQILKDIRPYLKNDGVLFVVTPDVASPMARLLGMKWWHFRLAHIGYFSPGNLKRLARQAGYDVVSLSRPWWFFTLDYAIERGNVYLPMFLQVPVFNWMKKVCIPVNFFDSMTIVLRASSNKD